MKTSKKVSVTIRGECTYVGEACTEVTLGEEVGAFVVHRGLMDKKGSWVATHPATGWRAISAPTKKVAVWYAQKLSELEVDWSFADPQTTKTWPRDVLRRIYIIVDLAKLGVIR